MAGMKNGQHVFGHAPYGRMIAGTAPAESWWVGAPRDRFLAQCWREWERMNRSPLALEGGLRSVVPRRQEAEE